MNELWIRPTFDTEEVAGSNPMALPLLEQWSVLVVEIRGIITASRARW